MITLHLTEQGQQDVSWNHALYFSHFIASNSFDYEDMEAWIRNNYYGDAVFKEFPVAYLNITSKGKTYSEGHTIIVLDHTIVDIAGAVETYKLDKSFEINSIGLIVYDPNYIGDAGHSHIYAFGELELNTYPLPVNENDSITYIIPFQVNYGDIIEPNLTAPDNLTPWKTFLDHQSNPVSNPKQVHNMWIDLPNLMLRVDNTSLPIPVQGESSGDIDARIRAIQEALVGAVKYKPEEQITPTTTFAAVDADNNVIKDSTVTVYSMANSASIDSLNSARSALQSLANLKCWAIGYRTDTNSSGWTTSGNIKYKDVIDNWVWRGLPLYPLAVVVIPRSKNFYDYGITYDVQIRNMQPYLRFYMDASVSITSNIYYHLFILYDLFYYNTHPEDIT
jgi:hypothetical protein